MASDTESATSVPTGANELPSIEQASTPTDQNDPNTCILTSSQVTIPPTEAPGSPIDDANTPVTAESQDGRIPSPTVVPSSMTPPPHMDDSAVAIPHANTTMTNGISASQASSLVSPPATVPNGTIRRAVAPRAPYTQPTPAQTLDASADDLRDMLAGAAEEMAHMRAELAGWRFRVNQLTRNEQEYSERHQVEITMMHREIEALCEVDRVRQVSQVPLVPRSVQADYETLQHRHRQLQVDYKSMQKKLKAAKRIIHEKDEANLALQDDKDMLLNRLRENREHAQQLLSPGKILHPTPKSSHHHHAMSTPQTGRSAARETPRSAAQSRPDHGQERFAALLNVLQQEDHSAPATPLAGHQPPRTSSGFKGHTRNVQSMSSIPTTPLGRPRGEHAGLLPSVDLVPRTEPRYNYSTNPFKPVNAPVLPPISSTPPRSVAHTSAGVLQRASSGDKSRESTISAEEDNTQELARQALQQFHRNAHQSVEEESRFDVARDAAPAAAEKTVRMHAKLFGQGEKRKHDEEATGQRRGLPTSPKRVKLPSSGLGIRDGR